jgi:hypothetical protein
MIFVAYPVGTGGHFLASVLSLLINNMQNTVLSDGSMHESINGYQVFNIRGHSGTEEEIDLGQIQRRLQKPNSTDHIMIGHLENLKRLTALSSELQVLYITVNTPRWFEIQQKNFYNKVVKQHWSKESYQRFATSSWPEFNPDLSQMPQWVIDDILNINLQHIKSWNFVLPEDQSRCLEIPIELTVQPIQLLTRIIGFLRLSPGEEQYQQAVDLINQYIKINNYEQ